MRQNFYLFIVEYKYNDNQKTSFISSYTYIPNVELDFF